MTGDRHPEMPGDPHESEARSERFAKNSLDEELLHALNLALSKASLPAPACTHDVARLPIIYIVGLPRSGTTLLSQIVSRHLPVGYINNLTARFWLRPSLGIRLSRMLLGGDGRESIGLTSEYGVTGGMTGPHEFGYFWRHWLKLDSAPSHHLTREAVALVDKQGLRQALEGEILAAFDAPVAFKNVICGFHAALLTAIHPQSLFVIIKRDLYAAAASILNARRERYGSYSAWWSLKPATYNAIAGIEDPARQVAKQVKDSLAEMEAELALPSVNAVSLAYDELCRAPLPAVEKICAKLAAMGTHLAPSHGVLRPLKESQPPALPQALEHALKAALADTAL